MPAVSKREHIVTTALNLFYKNGFNATGVDTIIAQAGVSKKTLYNHFRTKDELILATLRKRDELFRNFFMREVEKKEKTARGRLLAIFDMVDNWFKSDDFAGCMFINASAEFGAADNPNHIFCAEHKRLMLDYIRDLASQAAASNPDQLADQLNLLIEGAIVCAHVMGDKEAALKAKEMGMKFIESAIN
ncbi:TetR/AcrR family transcriptional regulator [Teredinibacter sp. KSP-S5-2]|uniref:TetR/AcrR family transcriptional regulator n=1 Tax=Teredinibacter sp. KSP-S5-2 TaxID=3034506 RepID=UPI002934EE11|nr:TetR/AcrR family transcriptional regulator [Teredinibacter sp. KSP-S5-2]WNO09299.1 TetR/AcrR family transcriptional regulator [Teredinibacter sp. KSP-S5-2]